MSSQIEPTQEIQKMQRSSHRKQQEYTVVLKLQMYGQLCSKYSIYMEARSIRYYICRQKNHGSKNTLPR
ncbi:hypothetical protein FGO68_gene9758 [Halteria grandinella]|uniref:Uncharacterized protein n=1 Tax=Halteria grandinella TaxID=5974 RepID=A0A8J8NAW2_HALGN|nr:hypothetical protein FGO68_gene9758 [Halteria grandinella]